MMAIPFFSKRFLPTVVDIMVIRIKFDHSHPFEFTDSKNIDVHSCCFLLDYLQFTLIHGSNIPVSYAIWCFTASDFTFTNRHIHSWASFLLQPSHFILSGAISNFPLLFHSIILDTFWWGVGGVITFFLFALFMVLAARILEWFAIPSSRGPHFVRTPH